MKMDQNGPIHFEKYSLFLQKIKKNKGRIKKNGSHGTYFKKLFLNLHIATMALTFFKEVFCCCVSVKLGILLNGLSSDTSRVELNTFRLYIAYSPPPLGGRLPYIRV